MGALKLGEISHQHINAYIEEKFAEVPVVQAATDAKDAAVVAQGLAETAQGLAETAKTGAETAKTGAETAETNAETAQAGAEDAAETVLETALGENGDIATAISTAVGTETTNRETADGLLQPKTGNGYTVATVPAAASNVGRIIFVSDGDEGDPTFAGSDGANWLIVGTMVQISAGA